ncbi:unnamed protein product [Lampetra planeri]
MALCASLVLTRNPTGRRNETPKEPSTADGSISVDCERMLFRTQLHALDQQREACARVRATLRPCVAPLARRVSGAPPAHYRQQQRGRP